MGKSPFSGKPWQTLVISCWLRTFCPFPDDIPRNFSHVFPGVFPHVPTWTCFYRWSSRGAQSMAAWRVGPRGSADFGVGARLKKPMCLMKSALSCWNSRNHVWYDMILYIYIISYIICDIIFHMYSYVICHIICHNMPYYMSCVICHSLGDIKSQKIQETQPSLRRRGAALGAPETDVIVGWTNIGLIEPTNIY